MEKEEAKKEEKEKEQQPYNDSDLYAYFLRKGTMTWSQLAALVNEQTGLALTAEALRKRIERHKSQAGRQGDGTARDLFRELEEKKQIFRDERNGWQRQNREAARTDANFAMLAEHLDGLRGSLFPVVPVPKGKAERRTMLILLTDWHVGLECQSIYGTYNNEVAERRVKILVQKITALQQREHCEAAVIMTAGDLIHGAIHRTVQIQSRDTVTTQIKTAVELLASFCQAMTGIFKTVSLTGCAGNHSRLQENKDSALHDERADDLINWMTGKLLSDCKRFSYIPPLDSSIASATIYGREVLAVHGDYDKMSKNGVQGLVTSLRRFPYAICYGHMHSPAMLETQGILAIQGGSLCGSGDDYTVQKRLNGAASQTVVLFTEEGLESIRPLFL